jgi:hypothetical protein
VKIVPAVLAGNTVVLAVAHTGGNAAPRRVGRTPPRGVVNVSGGNELGAR